MSYLRVLVHWSSGGTVGNEFIVTSNEVELDCSTAALGIIRLVSPKNDNLKFEKCQDWFHIKMMLENLRSVKNYCHFNNETLLQVFDS